MKKAKGISLAIRLVLAAIMVLTTFGFIAQPAFASTVNEFVDPSPPSYLLNNGDFTELIWWKISFDSTPALIRHQIEDPSGNVVETHDYSPPFTVVPAGGSEPFPQIYNPEDPTGAHLNDGDPDFAHQFDIEAGTEPGNWRSRVRYWSVEVLEGDPPDDTNWEKEAAETFWVRQPLMIYKYNDLNGDGNFDGTALPLPSSGEPGLNTWNFTVTGPGGYAAWGDTSSGGFLELPLISEDGDYIFTETLKSNWENTDPGAAYEPGPLQKTVTIPDDLEGPSPKIDPELPIVYFGNHLLAPDTDVDIEVSPDSLPFGGGLVTLTVRETNTGDLPLHTVSVDISGDATYTLYKSGSNPPGAVFNGVDGGVPDVLDPDETWEWTIAGILVTDTSSYTAIGHGLDPSDNDITFSEEYPNEIATADVEVGRPPNVPLTSTGLGILIAGLAGIMAFIVYRRAQRSR